MTTVEVSRTACSVERLLDLVRGLGRPRALDGGGDSRRELDADRQRAAVQGARAGEQDHEPERRLAERHQREGAQPCPLEQGGPLGPARDRREQVRRGPWMQLRGVRGQDAAESLDVTPLSEQLPELGIADAGSIRRPRDHRDRWLLEQVDHAPLGQRRGGQTSADRERGVRIRRAFERTRGLRQERQAMPGFDPRLLALACHLPSDPPRGFRSMGAGRTGGLVVRRVAG
jgi:hypothetical protein